MNQSVNSQPSQISGIEEIINLKITAEAALIEFKRCLLAITQKGYAVQIQPNDTLYIFKDQRTESYGEIVQPTQLNSQSKQLIV